MKMNIRKLDSLTHNDTAATKLINDNFNALQQGIEDSLSRTGKTPNFMDAELDMNKNRIINLGEPVDDSDLATKKYVDDSVAAEETRATGVENTLSGRIDGINGTLSSFGNIVTHDVNEFATAAQGAKADTAVQPSDLATVATTGSYNDLDDKPTIPVVNDSTITLTQGGSTMGSFTLNQAGNATIALNGESGGATWGLITGTLSNQTDLQDAFDDKQDTLVSGTNIKTLNGNSLLGSGDLEISSGGAAPVTFNMMTVDYVQVSSGNYYVNVDVTSKFEEADTNHYLFVVSVVASNGIAKYLKPFGMCKDLRLGQSTYSRTIKLFFSPEVINEPYWDSSTIRLYVAAFPIADSNDAIGSGGVIVKLMNRPNDTSIPDYIYNSEQINATFQTLSNLVTSVDSTSTDSQYPSAKLFYDTCGDIETLINAL